MLVLGLYQAFLRLKSAGAANTLLNSASLNPSHT